MRTLVVGVDGGASSLHALDWAVEAAGPDGVLRVVTATDAASGPEDRALVESVTGRLADLGARVGELSASTVEGDAADALAASADQLHADAIVVGAHVPPRAMPKRIGRTIRALVEPLRRPLVVVPTPAVVGRSGDAPVIVGVGHSDATEAAVCWAARWADDEGVPLGLVRATVEAPTFGLDGLLEVLAYYIDPSQRAVWTQEDLADFAALAQEVAGGDLEIATMAVGERPSSALVESSRGASLLVIGRHESTVLGEGHTARLLQHALTHATCPVVVVPPRPTPG